MTLRLLLIPLTVVALAALSGCAVPTDDTTPSSAWTGAADESGATQDDTDAGDEGAFADSWLFTASEQFAASQDPEPTFALASETAVEFTFPSGSVQGTDARSDCQIAMLAIGEEYALTMSYPDGSVLCSELMG